MADYTLRVSIQSNGLKYLPCIWSNNGQTLTLCLQHLGASALTARMKPF